jgi:hypothetical protein
LAALPAVEQQGPPRLAPRRRVGPGRPGGAFACFLVAGIVFGAALSMVAFPDLSMYVFWLPFTLMLGVLVLQGCSGLLAVVATILGACSFQTAFGKSATIGGALLLIGDVVYFLWAFSLG